MEEVIQIGSKQVTLKATANTPRKYREYFNKDLIVEMQGLLRHVKPDGAIGTGFDFGVVERLGYVMALQADSTIGSIDQWLDGFEMDDIYTASSAILGVWNKSRQGVAVQKKPQGQ